MEQKKNMKESELNKSGASKSDPFKKPGKPFTQDDTLTDSEFEKSVTRSNSLFKKTSKPADDLFCVSFNETNVNDTETETLVTSSTGVVSKGLMNKSNPFKKKKVTCNDSLEKENSIEISAVGDAERSIGNFEKSDKNLTLDKSSDSEDLEITKYITKTNPFMKKSKSHEEHSMQISTAEEGKSMEDVEKSEKSLDLEDVEPTKYIKKTNPFKKIKTHVEQSLQVSIAEGDSTVNNFTIDKSTDEANTFPKNLFKRNNKSKKESFGGDQIEDGNAAEVDDSSHDDNDGGSDSSNDGDNDHYVSNDNYNDESVDVQNDEDDENDDDMEPSIGRKSCGVKEKIEENLSINESVTKQSDLSFIVSPVKSNISTDKSPTKQSDLSFIVSPVKSNISTDKSPTKQSDLSAIIPPIEANISLTKEKPEEGNVTSATNANRTMTWEEKFNEIVSKSKKGSQTVVEKKPEPAKLLAKQKEKPLEEVNEYKPMRLKKPAPYATKRLYKYIINKLEPKYGIDTLIEAEQIVFTICDTVKKVSRRKTHQKKLIQDLKKELATVGLIETTMDFYEFVIEFLPYPFRVKVVPCLQTRTNTVFPPKNVGNPFDKIF